jgi:toxin ParE1/3/4
MKPRFVVDARAQQDLQEIYEYIARDSPRAAARMMRRFREMFAVLGRNPTMGELRLDLPEKLRCFSVASYVILFRPSEIGVEIARVIHGARDFDQIFPREPE